MKEETSQVKIGKGLHERVKKISDKEGKFLQKFIAYLIELGLKVYLKRGSR